MAPPRPWRREFRKAVWLWAGGMALWAWFGCADALAEGAGGFFGDRIALRVNSEVLTAGQVESAFLQAGVGLTSAPRARRAALDALVDFLLLRQESREEPIDDVQPELRERGRIALEQVRSRFSDGAEFRAALAARGLDVDGLRRQLEEREADVERISRRVARAIKPADLVAAGSHDQEAGVGTAVRLRRFGLKVRRGETTAPARLMDLLADSILERRGFEDLVRRHSEVPGAREDGGELGWIPLKDLDDGLRREVERAAVGRVAGPMRAGEYWCLFEVTGRAGGAPSQNQRALQAARERILRRARRSASVEVLDPQLRALRSEDAPARATSTGGPGRQATGNRQEN